MKRCSTSKPLAAAPVAVNKLIHLAQGAGLAPLGAVNHSAPISPQPLLQSQHATQAAKTNPAHQSGGAEMPQHTEQSRETVGGDAAKVLYKESEQMNFNSSPPRGRGKRKSNAYATVQITSADLYKLNAEIDEADLALIDTSKVSQLRCLLKVLAYIGVRGLGTCEARALGYESPAPRMMELRAQGYIIFTTYENVIKDDGYCHPRMARYRLIANAPQAITQGGN